MVNIMIGIIGGSGLSDPSVLCVDNGKNISVDTPFGQPSAPILTGTINGVPVAVLARHGVGHRVMPSRVNYRANLAALRQLGCTHVLASTAAGSLRQHIEPGHLVLPDQFVDRTHGRQLTLFDGQRGEDNGDDCQFAGICHLPMAEPFCARTRRILAQCASACLSRDTTLHEQGTVVCIEGPRFSTRAESQLFRQWNCDLVNMTSVPEVALANELAMCYAAVAIATDYDCWRTDAPPVSVASVLDVFGANVAKVVRLFRASVATIAAEDWSDELKRRQDVVKQNIMLPH